MVLTVQSRTKTVPTHLPINQNVMQPDAVLKRSRQYDLMILDFKGIANA